METTNQENAPRKARGNKGAGVGSGVYGLAFIGAAVYYIQHAQNFGDGVIGIIKAMLWPAFVIYRLLGFLGM